MSSNDGHGRPRHRCPSRHRNLPCRERQCRYRTPMTARVVAIPAPFRRRARRRIRTLPRRPRCCCAPGPGRRRAGPAPGSRRPRRPDREPLTREPIGGARIQLVGTRVAIFTDSAGRFGMHRLSSGEVSHRSTRHRLPDGPLAAHAPDGHHRRPRLRDGAADGRARHRARSRRPRTPTGARDRLRVPAPPRHRLLHHPRGHRPAPGDDPERPADHRPRGIRLVRRRQCAASR